MRRQVPDAERAWVREPAAQALLAAGSSGCMVAGRACSPPNGPPISGLVPEVVERQLGPLLVPVYGDEGCALWRVQR